MTRKSPGRVKTHQPTSWTDRPLHFCSGGHRCLGPHKVQLFSFLVMCQHLTKSVINFLKKMRVIVFLPVKKGAWRKNSWILGVMKRRWAFGVPKEQRVAICPLSHTLSRVAWQPSASFSCPLSSVTWQLWSLLVFQPPLRKMFMLKTLKDFLLN